MKISAAPHSEKKSSREEGLHESGSQRNSRTTVFSYPAPGTFSTLNTSLAEYITSQKSFPAPLQLKRNRKDEEAKTTQQKSASMVLQRVVADNIASNTPIVIDNPQASDFGDTGIVKRHSSMVQNCQAIEFDNERGVEYRVMNYEMSKRTGDQEAAGPPSKFRINARHDQTSVIITGEFVMSAKPQQDFNFVATLDDIVIGVLTLISLDGQTFYLRDIKVNQEFAAQVKGLGAALMHIASSMGVKLGGEMIRLSATKMSDETPHPAPFYHRFGFDAPEELAVFDNNWASYFETMGTGIIDMRATPSNVKHTTATYLDTNGWTFSGWEYSG
jgi:hypothetical protein